VGQIGLIEWVTEAQAGSQQAIARIYSYLRLQLEPLLRVVPPGIDAEDVFEETALVVFQNISRVRDSEKISHYASQVFRHLVQKLNRERRRCLSLVDDGEIASPDLTATNLERDELLQRLIGAINGVERELFSLIYIEGLNNRELAQKLRISDSIGRHRKHALNRKLRAVLVRLAKADGSKGAAGVMIP
jgi:RNA polymerase sigma factor (sigma-70 family)